MNIFFLLFFDSQSELETEIDKLQNNFDFDFDTLFCIVCSLLYGNRLRGNNFFDGGLPFYEVLNVVIVIVIVVSVVVLFCVVVVVAVVLCCFVLLLL
jgi:hypothetical protein